MRGDIRPNERLNEAAALGVGFDVKPSAVVLRVDLDIAAALGIVEQGQFDSAFIRDEDGGGQVRVKEGGDGGGRCGAKRGVVPR